MGQTVSSALICRRTPNLRIVICGLDAAGKTSILYRLKTGGLVCTIPTIGFNVELVTVDGRANLTMWDIGGRDKIRPLLKHYYPNSHGVLYIVDSTDSERLSETIDELNRLCSDLVECEVGDIPVAVLCNKCDLQSDATTETRQELHNVALSISNPKKAGQSRRPCRCFEVSATTGAGLTEAIDWLVAAALNELPKEQLLEEINESAEVGKSKGAVSSWRGSLYGFMKSVMLR